MTNIINSAGLNFSCVFRGIVVALAMFVLLAGCGGGGSPDRGVTVGCANAPILGTGSCIPFVVDPYVRIHGDNSVRRVDRTFEDLLLLGGHAFGLDSGAPITWRNTANGASGIVDSRSSDKCGIYPVYDCEAWRINSIPLAFGDNRITVSSRSQSGNALQDTLLVTRDAPSVEATTPANGATDVAANSAILVLFAQDMDPATISNSSVYLRDSFNSIVAVGVTYSDRIATINPVTLQPLTVYTGVVTADAKDLHGYSLPFEYTWTFTSVDLDRMSPEVQVTNPSDGATDVPWNIRLGVGFSENIDPASISSSTVYVRDAAFNVVSADIHISSGKDLLITPQSLLAPIKAYTGIVTTGVRDLAGNPITTEYSWSFTTADVERIPPEVTATIPENGATCVPVETEIRVSTSEQLLSDSVNDTTFYVKDALSNPVDATIRDVWDRATLAPTSPLAASTSYTATMSTGVTDLNGNPFATNQTLTFTTDGPGTGSWGDISMVNAPALRKRHTAIWTGAEMIVWGGFNESVPGGYLGDGARYDPLSDIWTPVSDVGAPSSRQGHTAVWTDSEMIIWGGGDASGKGDGARYDPATDTWKSISNVGAPTPKTNHTAVWTGSEMIIWGYRSGTTEPEGARYDPATDTWTPLSMVGAPRQILFHSAVWTGTEMIIWGGGEIDGARYDPANDTWTQMSTVNGPSLRRGHVAAWTGSEMLVWGGVWLAAGSLGSGARYDTITDTWHPMNSVCAPLPRAWAAGVWTGSDFVLWGGLEYWGGEALQFRGGGRYDPLTNTWRSTPLDNAPTGGLDPTAVWTGSEVIVWGPSGGGRYRP